MVSGAVVNWIILFPMFQLRFRVPADGCLQQIKSVGKLIGNKKSCAVILFVFLNRAETQSKLTNQAKTLMY